MPLPSYHSEIVSDMETIATQAGYMFRAYTKLTLAASQTRYVLVKTPTDKAVVFHSRKLKARGASVDVFIYLGGTVSANGTQSTKVFNLNSMSPKPTTALFYVDPTVTADGVEVDTDILEGGSQGQSSSGGFGQDSFERILPANAAFLVKFVNLNNANPVDVLYEVIWQEFVV